MFTKTDLLKNLADLGLTSGDLVMVHASLRALGPVLGGADVLIDALLDRIAPDGTMMMYIGCESPFDEIGRGNWSEVEECFILENCPPFDPQTARASRQFGALAELFRTRAGTLCSAHVGWRMAASGAEARELTQNHPLDYGADKDSPLERLVQKNGKVLLLGSDPDKATVLHYAEGLTAIPGKKTVRIKVPLL